MKFSFELLIEKLHHAELYVQLNKSPRRCLLIVLKAIYFIICRATAVIFILEAVEVIAD